MDLEGNAERFSGFADLYDAVRPNPPPALGELLVAYAGDEDGPRVVDLGCGTGLSTRWCATWARSVVGVEPSADMLRRARAAMWPPTVALRTGWAHATGVADASADVAVAVQALHWMEPEATFAEVARILRPGGVFAAIDCDWPPAIGDAMLERDWLRCRAAVKRAEALVADGVEGDDLRAALRRVEPGSLDVTSDSHLDRRPIPSVRVWPKEEHLARMRASGHFEWCRELAVHATEQGDADRFVDLLRSQGDFQTVRRCGATEDDLGVTDFAGLARERLGTRARPIWFTYRVRLGVTPVG